MNKVSRTDPCRVDSLQEGSAGAMGNPVARAQAAVLDDPHPNGGSRFALAPADPAAPAHPSDRAVPARPSILALPQVARVRWPVRAANLVNRLRANALERAGDAAFVGIFDDAAHHTTLTFGALDERARAIAARLQRMCRPGERVVLAYPPGLDFIPAFFGVLYAGCVAVPAYPPRRRTIERFAAIAHDAGARVALSTAPSIAQFETMRDAMREAGPAAFPDLHWLATDALDGADGADWSEYDPAPDTLAMIQYTSGSTRAPKGVALSHANLVANIRGIAASFEIRRDSVGVVWLPAYHDMGLIGGVLAPVFTGITNIMMAPASFLQNPLSWLAAISRYRATMSGGPNFAYDLCVRRIDAAQRATLDLSNWSLAFTGAEAVRPDTLARFADAFAPCGFHPASFYPCYGLAEATLMVTGPKSGTGAAVRAFDAGALARNRVVPLPAHAPDGRRLVGCGKAVGAMSVAIVDGPTRAALAPDHIGEIWLTGESVGQGYWQDPAATAATFRAHRSDSGRGPYLRTGDLGFLHDGELFITGRCDDLIIVRGLNHHPQDIEASARASHPLLESGLGAAFAVEDGDGQRLVLVHEVERDGTRDLEPVLAAVAAAITAGHGLALDAIVLIRCGTIAKTSSGKVQRHASRNAFVAGELRSLARRDRAALALAPPMPEPSASAMPSMPSAALAAICQHALAMSGTVLADVTPDTPIESLGLDSLQRVELVAALDRSFGRHLPDTVYSHATTLGDLAHAVQRHLIDHPPTDAHPREIPAENYSVALFPEYLELKRHERMVVAVADGNPYFRVDAGSATPDAGSTAAARAPLTSFCAYDYIGMARDPVVSAATKAAIDRYGTGAGASRLVSGEKQIHRELESALAGFLGTPAAVVFVSGHATNVTTIGHLLGPGDLVVHDLLAHNSILQGARLSGATSRGFAHNDWRALDALLAGIRHDFRRVLIAIEAIYSMDGDFPDLARFVEVKARHRALLLVDEAHSLGTMGATGRGIGEHAGIDRADVELWMGTLSKSLASCGGYIAGAPELVEYLKYTAPGFVYSVGLSPPNAATALAALTLLQREPQRVARLHALAGLFLALARDAGLDTGHAGGTPIVPVIVGNSVRCLRVARALFRRGIEVQPIIGPAVPEHAARLRLFITTNHTERQIRDAVAALVEELARS